MVSGVDTPVDGCMGRAIHGNVGFVRVHVMGRQVGRLMGDAVGK